MKMVAIPMLTAGLLAMQATVCISQTAPGTLTNPFQGGATLLQFSRSAEKATLGGGRVLYYQCGSMETQLTVRHTLTASLTASPCDELPDLKTGIAGQWTQWIRVTPGPNGSRYQGLHAATLSLTDATTGALLATLDCRGSNGVGTHHAPLSEAAEACAQPLHFEGTFSGRMVGGPYKGAFLQGTYAGDLTADPVQSEQGQPVSLDMEGVVVKQCPQRFSTGAAPGYAGALKTLNIPPAK